MTEASFISMNNKPTIDKLFCTTTPGDYLFFGCILFLCTLIPYIGVLGPFLLLIGGICFFKFFSLFGEGLQEVSAKCTKTWRLMSYSGFLFIICLVIEIFLSIISASSEHLILGIIGAVFLLIALISLFSCSLSLKSNYSGALSKFGTSMIGFGIAAVILCVPVSYVMIVHIEAYKVLTVAAVLLSALVMIGLTAGVPMWKMLHQGYLDFLRSINKNINYV